LAASKALHVCISVAPQHPFGHAGGAAGVQDVQVVGTPVDGRFVGMTAGERIFVPDRTGQQWQLGLVGDLQDQPQSGQQRQHLSKRRCESAVHHDRTRLCIVE